MQLKSSPEKKTKKKKKDIKDSCIYDWVQWGRQTDRP